MGLSLTGVDVYLVDPTAVTDKPLLHSYLSLLSDAEQHKCERYRFEKDRHQCLVTRALVRTTLSRYCPQIEPGAWRFVVVANGRPELAPGQTELPIRFNVSHTDGLIACAVAREHAVGVDVESFGRRGETLAIADRYFAPAEVKALRAQPIKTQRERFFSYWTLKEAYIKARGEGLAIPLRQFAFEIDGPGPITVSFDPELEDTPALWQFALIRPTPGHMLALGVRRRPDVDFDIGVRFVVPLRS